MRGLAVFVILSALVLLEASVVELPVVLLFLVCLATVKKDAGVFLLAFISGILLDILLLRQIGITGIILVTMVFLIMLYQRKFEIASYYFIVFASFFTTLIYALLFRSHSVFLQAVVCAFLSLLFFTLLKVIYQKHEKPHVI